MTAKKKVVIAVSSFVVLILATVIVVVSVLAAQSVTVASGNISVIYKSYEVKANVKAFYKISGADKAFDELLEEEKTEWQTPDGESQISFDGTESDGEGKTLQELNNLELDRVNNSIYFIFQFENTSGVKIQAWVTNLPGMTNMQVVYICDDLEDWSEDVVTGMCMEMNVGETKTLIFKYTIDDISLNASIEGSFEWGIYSNR